MSSVVLVTGASTGIGRLAVETIARAGHRVYAGMRDLSGRNAAPARELQDLAAARQLSLVPVEMDVQQTASVQRAVDQVVREAGRIDVVVNNAGIMSIGLAEGFTEEQVFQQMDVNFMGSFRVSRAVLPHLRKQNSGLIIHVASILGRLLFPGCASLLRQQICPGSFGRSAELRALRHGCGERDRRTRAVSVSTLTQ